MASVDYYHILNIERTATQAEIKQAYRSLAKRFHPDSQHQLANHERITQINAAYAVLKDPRQRRGYDQQLRNFNSPASTYHASPAPPRPHRASASAPPRQTARTARATDEHLQRWLKQVYTPVNRRLHHIQSQLKDEIRWLSQDPFDDDLMADFQTYLEESRTSLVTAQALFQSMANPANMASVAAQLYYCLTHLEDGIDELERFTLCYDDYYLNTGRELFRISGKLREEAQAKMRAVL